MSGTGDGSTLKFAVVGAGPAGFYTVETLAAACPGCRIDLIERLPTPFGLVRSGVAPDHQSTKNIQETFAKIAELPNVRFLGNVEVGRDVTLAELNEIYDAVVLASGAPHDAPLAIPGERLRGVYGAAQFVGWYNAHPDFAALDPMLDRAGAVIIGNGNVAIDVARVLSKSVEELAASDIAAYARARLAVSSITDVHIVGRRGPLDAKFTTIELGELGELKEAVAVADPAQIPETVGDGFSPRDKRVKAKNLDCFQSFAKADAASRARRIRFQFNARPVEILGQERVEAVRFERTQVIAGGVTGTGETFDVPCGMVVAAIGYRAHPFDGLAVAESGDRLRNDNGLIRSGLYVVGWLKRGPSGKIGTNRNDGEEIGARICAEVAISGKPGFAALESLLHKRGVRVTDFADWKMIERAEIAAAPPGAPRQKFARIADMLACLDRAREAVA